MGSRGRRARAVVAVAAIVVGGSFGAIEADAAPGVNCATQSLQARIDAAPAGSTLLVHGTCVGNFVVSKNLTIKGSPAATLDGNRPAARC